MIKIKKIHHIGVAVKDLDGSLQLWNQILGLRLTGTEEVPTHKVKVAFLQTGDSEIELLSPLEGNTALEELIREKGGGLDHLCLEVEDLALTLRELKENGIELIDETPKELPGRRIAFVHPSSADGVLLEFYELT